MLSVYITAIYRLPLESLRSSEAHLLGCESVPHQNACKCLESKGRKKGQG